MEFKIDLKENAVPVKQKVRPLAPPLKDNLKIQLDAWLRDSVIEPAESPWASPLVPVKKKKGPTRWATDFRILNSLTIDDSFPTPNISEVLETLSESKVFSTLDASNAYHSISIEEKSRPLTAFTTAYLDDLLLHTQDVPSHMKLLKLVLEAHRAAGIKLNPEKTCLFQATVEYLGYQIST